MESFPVDGKRALAVTSERAGAYMHGGGEGQTEVQLAGWGRKDLDLGRASRGKKQKQTKKRNAGQRGSNAAQLQEENE